MKWRSLSLRQGPGLIYFDDIGSSRTEVSAAKQREPHSLDPPSAAAREGEAHPNSLRMRGRREPLPMKGAPEKSSDFSGCKKANRATIGVKNLNDSLDPP